jgi:hypothetical protein
MKYKFEITQTIYKNIEVEADNEHEACDKVGDMLNGGEIHFNDEPFLKMECNFRGSLT